ncbi:MAG: hypothetical protein GW949_07760 [Spirochaetales bacterium]|nr:hypothetical protein [Spirochaetales bacterium]
MRVEMEDPVKKEKNRPLGVLTFALLLMLSLVSPVFLTTADETNGGVVDSAPPPPPPAPALVNLEDHEVLEPLTYPSILEQNTIVGYYGNPNSNRMGILGEYSKAALAERLIQTAAAYDEVNGDRGVIRAFHLIFATVWADGQSGRLSPALIRDYIRFAQDNGMVVILDHQIGIGDPEQSFREMLPYLLEGPVHLAIDPEWRTTQPGEEIGWVYAEEVNRLQEIMDDYLQENGVTERRMLLVHQFHPKMIQNRDEVRTDYPLVDLVLNADGFGPPALKVSSWRHSVLAENIPLKGFKLFYPKPWKTFGTDIPLMSPAQVMELVPQPVYINYQ